MELPAQLGEFRIEELLGQGGSGIVYRAAWGPRKVALKVLHPGLSGTGKERAQFLAEAQKLQQITHPAVVKVFAVGTLPDGRPYLAMELLHGETLAQVIAHGGLGIAAALALFGELAAAVEALHAQGLVHRDLKPENVFVVDGRHAVLLDFGIAKDLAAPSSTTTQEGHVRGTPAYMAPERFFGQAASIATDVYELAVVLYAMLSGRLPWDELADPEARLSPRPLVEIASVPEALDVEIRRALSTRAQNRPTSAAALHAAVRAAASDLAAAPEPAETARMRPAPEDARPPPGDQPTPLAWAPTLAAPATHASAAHRRWPWIAGISALAITGGIAAWTRLRDSSPQATVAPPVVATAKPSVPKPDPNDPWSGAPQPTEPPKALPLTQPKLTVETYRAEAAAAIARLPSDVRVVFGLQLGELRAQETTADMLDKLAKHPKVAAMATMLPPCVKAIAGDAEWIVLGAPSLEGFDKGALVIRGRWARKDVEACIGDGIKPNTVRDGSRLYRIGDFGWLDFVDEHTAYATMRADLGAEAVHALTRHGGGPQGHARDLVTRLPADRTFAFVADGHAGDDWPSMGLALPKGSDLYGWFRVEPTGLVLDMAGDAHDAAAAKAGAAAIKPQIDELFSADGGSAIGKLEVVVEHTVVHLRGGMTSLMLGMMNAAISM